ncbi:MAG TPA: GntR family transcriptional regulator [Longimicrobiales bacterium]|nr:GntR family transcriptional regulator [Longimicrobiales bacterium]
MAKDNAVHRAYLEIRDQIVTGARAPGSPLIERRVAQAVGASRTTVRNALQQLANEGFVTVSSIGSHYSRFFVAPMNVDEMREWYYIFGALDGIAARGAAGLPEARRKGVVERGRRLAREIVAAGEADPPQYDRIAGLDAAFHGSYVQAGAGPRLHSVHAFLRPHVDRYGTFYLTELLRKIPSEVHQEHCAIMDAIEAGDPDAAEQAGIANWRNATIRFETIMRQRGEAGRGR